MDKRLGWLLRIVVLLILILIPTYSNLKSVAQPPATRETLSVQVEQARVGPKIAGQNPLPGQRLDLSPVIQVTFDRDMDREKTGGSFSFLGPDEQAISGQINWLDARTFEFTPDAKLEPFSDYKAIFSTQAAAADGTSPEEALELDYTTVEKLGVAQVFPAADAEAVDGNTTITVIFNRAIVPLRIEEEQSGLPQPLEFSPSVTGQGQWVNSSVYVFQPEEPLLSGVRYTVRVEAGLQDTTGNLLEEAYLWQFSTRTPAIGYVALQNGPEGPDLDHVENVLLDQAFIVTFLQAMDADSLAEAASVINRETGKPEPLRLSWNKEFTVLTIRPRGRYQIANFYDLTIADTARAADGGLLQDGLTVKFSTIPPPQIVKTSPEPNSKPKDFDSGLRFQFASPMRFDSLKSRVVITPAPKEKPQLYYNDYDWSLNIWGLEPATEYVVRVLPGMADIYGNTIKSEYSFTFKTGDMQPDARLLLPWTPLVYRAQGPQEVYFDHLNLDTVKISLYPLTFSEFHALLSNGDATDFKPQVQPVREWKPETAGARNQLNRLNFQLQDPKGNPLDPGYYFIGVQGEPLDYDSRFYQGFLFVVATENLTFKATATEGLGWAVDLESGRPQADVSVIFYNDKFREIGSAKTDKNGLAYVSGINSPVYARVEGGGHVAFTALDWGSGVWAGDFGIAEGYYGTPVTSFVYLYTDRPVYRPGQEVYFKGLARRNDDLHYSRIAQTRLHVTIEQDGEQLYAEYLPVAELGNISDKFKLADDAALGTYMVFVRAHPAADPIGMLSFRVAEYHKPEFQVKTSADKDDVVIGDRVNFSLDAAYYSGGDVGNAEMEWFLEAGPYYFTPAAKYSGFSFTDWERDLYYSSPTSARAAGTLAQGQAVLDANGHLDISRSLDLSGRQTSQVVTFMANVTDLAGNVVSGRTSVVVHQGQLYAGIRSLSYVGTQGKEQPFEVVVLDWDSKPVAGQAVTVKFVERKWFSVQKQDKNGMVSWVTSVKEIPAGEKTAVTGEDGTAQVAFVPPSGGVYKAIVTVRDSKGNLQQASAYMWVSSDEYIAWRQTNDRTFSVIADKDMYTPGDTAELLIAQPFEGSVYALVTFERGHIYRQEVVRLTGNSTVFKLPVTGDMAPLAYVSVVVVSGAKDTQTPDFKIGMAVVNVDTSRQQLDVQVTTDKKSSQPGGQVTYTVLTRDQDGKPVSTDVSLAVLDKAALALAPSNSGPILESFYPKRALSVRTALGLVSNAEDFNAQYEAPAEGGGSGGGGGGDSLGIITVRQDFKDTAFFRAQVTTDEKGRAQITVKLPENLTTWVADVRAATLDGRVGQATQELVSTKPLFVELQTPRFFVAGDQARVGATVHNNGGARLTAQVTLTAQGGDLISEAAQVITVEAKDQAYVTWDLKVGTGAQRVDLTAQAVSGGYQDSSKPALGSLPGQGIPVYTYTAVETVGASGMLVSKDSATESIQLPTTFDYTDAQLSIEVSPSLAASMQSSLTFLQDYEYLCMEQTVSRFLPNVVTARALELAGVSNTALQRNLDQQVSSALQRIYAKQKPDGGWHWWDGPVSDDQTSAYVVLGLFEAKRAGYSISTSVLDNGIEYLKLNLRALGPNDPKWQYNRQAFILYVLARAGELQAGRTNFIYQHRTSLDLYGKAYLAQALYLLDPEDKRIASLMSDLGAAAVMSAAGAHWEEDAVDYWNWNTDTRTTAIVLNAFVMIDPGNPITVNAVRWLMAHRQSGHWPSTQETVWSLLALTDWLSASQEYETDYQFAIGLNGDLLEQGRATREHLTETTRLRIEMKELLKDTANFLVFTRGGGSGNLYYDAYLSTSLPVESIQPLDQGVSLARQYFTLDDPKTPITQIERGELVQVRLTIVAPAAVHYVVIDDPLPAGLEAIDESILTDTQVPDVYTVQDYTERGWGWWYFTHTELRDEKVVLSADYLPAGTYVYTYLARASTAGTFKVIPPTASEFYFPDVGGRGAGSLFTVMP